MKKRQDIVEEWKALTGEEPPAGAPFTVPEGYFEALPEETLQMIRAQEGLAGKEDPVLSAGRVKLPPYETPANYFDGLPEEVRRRVSADTPVVSMRSRRPGKRWIAAAALACLIAASGGWWLLRQQQRLDRQLAKLSDQTIESYLEDHTDLFDREALYDNLNGEALQQQAAFTNTINSNVIREYLENYDFDTP